MSIIVLCPSVLAFVFTLVHVHNSIYSCTCVHAYICMHEFVFNMYFYRERGGAGGTDSRRGSLQIS